VYAEFLGKDAGVEAEVRGEHVGGTIVVLVIIVLTPDSTQTWLSDNPALSAPGFGGSALGTAAV
jgi:hypothetical protein